MRFYDVTHIHLKKEINEVVWKLIRDEQNRTSEIFVLAYE